MKEQTEARQQAERSLADLQQKKMEVDEALADEKKSRQEAEDALASETNRRQNALADAEGRCQQITQASADSVTTLFTFHAQLHLRLDLFSAGNRC